MQFRGKSVLASLLFVGVLCLPGLLAEFPNRISSVDLSSRTPSAILQCSDIFGEDVHFIDPLAKIRQAAIGGLFHRPSLLPYDSHWYVRADENKHVWITGASHLARGVTDIYVRTPERISENESFLLLLENFRNNGLDIIHPSKAGMAITLDSPPMKRETFQVISLNALKDSHTRKETLEAQENLPEDFFNFVFNGYRKRMEIDDATIERLREISRQVENRTLLFIKTKEAYVEMRPQSNEFVYLQDRRKLPANPLEAARVMGRLMPAHFTLEAGASVVISNNASEKLPLELFTGFEIPRTGNGKIVEAGRFYVDKPGPEEATTSTRIVGVLASLLQREDVSSMVIEADAARARLFSRLGFKPIHKRTNFAGRTEYIMEAPPSVVAESVARTLLEQLEPNAHLPRTLSAPQRILQYSDPKRSLSPDDVRSNATSLGGIYDIGAVLSQVHDLALSDYAGPVKQQSAELLLQHFKGLQALAPVEIKNSAAYLLKKGPSQQDLEGSFIAWLKNAGRTGLVNSLFPYLPVKEYCNTHLKDLRDSLWDQRKPQAQALEILVKAIHDQSTLSQGLGADGAKSFARKLLDPANGGVAPFDVSLDVIREKIYLEYGKPR